MPEEVNAHGLGSHLVVPDGLEGPAVGGVHQQDDNQDTDGGNEHGEQGVQLEDGAADLDLDVVEVGVLAQQVGAVGDNAQAVPLEHRTDNLRKAQGGDGQVVALQPQNGDADEGCKHRRNQAGNDDADDGAPEGAGVLPQHTAENLRNGEADGAAVKVLIDRLVLVGGDGENGEGVRADEHKARLAQGEKPRKAVKQVHGHADQRENGALLQHGDQHHRHRVGGDGVIQQEEEHIEDHQENDGDERAGLLLGSPFFLELFSHSPHLTLCPWPSHRRYR